MVKISVVIPCFNVAQYIVKCIEFFLCQQYSNLELIIVDDGSKDYLMDVIQQYIDRGVVKYTRQENQGVSVARNKGLEIATGEYVYFCDPDDYVEPNLLYTLNVEIQRKRFDLISFNVTRKTFDENNILLTTHVEGYSRCEYNNNEDIIKYILPKHMGTTHKELDNTGKGNALTANHETTGIWLFCIKKSFLSANNILFVPGMRLGEDRMFISQCIAYANSFSHIGAPLYVYEFRSDGCYTDLTQRSYGTIASIRSFWIDKYSEFRLKYLRERNFDLYPYYVVTCLIFLDEIINNLAHIKYVEGCRQLRQYLQLKDVKTAISIVKLDKCSKYYKIRYSIYKYHLAYLWLLIKRSRCFLCDLYEKKFKL